MKHVFIVNPAAGKGRPLKLVPLIRSHCNEHQCEYDIVVTEYPGHATEIAAAKSASGKCRIYSVGGDGTLNEVLNGMAGTGSNLAVIPSGSGNDFIRSIVGRDVPDDIIPATIRGTERLIDYARVNDKYFINIASVGFDAKVAHQTNHFKKLPLISGTVAYILGILNTILISSSEYMELKLDDRVISGETLLIAVGIGKYYGGGINALPDAVIDDGLFDVCYVEAVPKLKILRLFPQYIKGLHASIEGVHLLRGRKVEITAKKPIPLNRDGEIILAEKAVFEIFPEGLPIVVPNFDQTTSSKRYCAV
jgi:YegS/Rv2252/BmrU family lipid kinase